MDNLLKNIKMEVGLSDYAEFVMNKLDQMIENETDEAKKEELSNLQERISGGIEWFNEANLRLDDLIEATHVASNVMDNSDYQAETTNEVDVTQEQTLPSDIYTDEAVEDTVEPINEVAVTDEQSEEQNDEIEDEEIVAEGESVEENTEEVVAEEQPVEENTEEVVAEKQPVEENTEEVVAEEQPVEENTEEVVAEEQPVEENQVVPAVELPVIDEQSVTEEAAAEEIKEDAQTFVREAASTTVDKGVSITPDQKNNLAGSLETQEALIGSVGAAPMANEVVQPESVEAEQPVEETTEMTAEQELEKMTQEYTEALSSGNEAKAEELSNAISEKNKQLAKVA